MFNVNLKKLLCKRKRIFAFTAVTSVKPTQRPSRTVFYRYPIIVNMHVHSDVPGSSPVAKIFKAFDILFGGQ